MFKNQTKKINLAIVKELIDKQGYKDLGSANSGAEFTTNSNERRQLDCSTYKNKTTYLILIDDVNKEILHVDMTS